MLFITQVQTIVAQRDTTTYSTNPTFSPDTAQIPQTSPIDTLITVTSDSLATDTATQKRDELEAPVIYQSQDSMVWYKNGNAYLYGDGQVNYQSIELKAIIAP